MVKYMNKSKIKLLVLIIVFLIISVISIYSSQNLLSSNYNNLYIKQLFWYLIGFLLIVILSNKRIIINNLIINYIYILNILLLILVLFFGNLSNGARCWFSIPLIGSFQPSEFMKIALILMLSKEINKYNYEGFKRNFKNEFIVIIKCLLLTLIPSFFTFLEPDTGAVIIYFIILFFTLFTYGIRYRWFIFGFSIIILLFVPFFGLFFTNKNQFIKIFGTDFFYRMDRLLDWKKGSGMQLTNALASSSSAGLYGYGLNKNPIYYPEPHTDFIFSVFLTNFGFLGAIILIISIILFDSEIIRIGIELKNKNKYIISGFLGVIIFQQIQNISMNIGLLPITGITLPFISYGGSSLISYMLMIGIIFNITNKNQLYTFKNFKNFD